MGITIIDGNNLAYRSWTSMDTDTLTNGGDSVSVIFGFLKSLSYTLRMPEIPNETVIIVWDIGKSAHRLSLYPDYKANRTRDVDDKLSFEDFIRQTDLLKEVLSALPIYQLQLKGYEGDDLIAGVCNLFDKTKKVIVTADKDLAQLINDNTYMYKLGMFKKDHKLIRPDNFSEINSKCKIPYNQILDYKVLNGDKSDNINGVNGIGDKTIEKLFEKYGSLSKALDHADELLSDSKLKKIFETETYINSITGEEEVRYVNLEIIERNYKLMDTNSFLTDELLIYVGEVMLKPVMFNDSAFKKFLMQYNFNSYLNRYSSFIEPFILKKGATYERHPLLGFTLTQA
jgi:DNA polymerase-1